MYKYKRWAILALLLAILLVTPQAQFVRAQDSSGGTVSSDSDPSNVTLDVQVVGDVVSITWTTSSPSTGWVEYGSAIDKLENIASDERGSDVVDTQHRVRLEGLVSGSLYYFSAVSSQSDLAQTRHSGKFTLGTEQLQTQSVSQDFPVAPDATQIESEQFGTEVAEPLHPWGVTASRTVETEFSVVWRTDQAQTGWIVYGQTPDNLDNMAFGSEGQAGISTDHQVTISGLEPGKTYYYVVVSGGTKYDNSGSPFKIMMGDAQEVMSSDGVSNDQVTESVAQPQEATVYNRIGIEAGHSDSDPGAMSCDGRYREEDNNEAVANLAATILRQRGYTVDIFRGGASGMRGYQADAFVSLHNDWCASGASGFKVSRYGGRAGSGTNGTDDASDRLVNAIWTHYRSATNMAEDRSPGHFTNNMLNYYALSWISSNTPGAIIEMGWWSGDEDMLLNHRDLLAAGVANSILAFLGNNDPDDNRVLTSGQTVNGTINPANDEDTYYFDASQGQLATLRMDRTATTLDGYLTLYAPNGTVVAQDDDSGGNMNPWINRATLPQNGRYRLVARSFGRSSTGGYSLRLNVESAGSTCTPGANGVVLYEHPNHQGRCITFTGDDNDFNNDNFNDIASSLRFVGSYASGWEAQLYEHTYYGGVSSIYRSNDSDFSNDTIAHDRASSIRIRRVTATDPDDNRTLSSGQTLGGTINPANDEDVYYFDASQGQLATLRMNRTATTLDGYLILYAPSGSEITRDDDSGGSYNPWINRVTLPQNGRYRVVAKSYNGGSTGGYNLSLNLESNTCTDNAAFVGQSAYPTVQAGQTFQIYFEVRNTGSCTWSQGNNYYLSNTNGTTLGANGRQELGSNVAPNSTKRWTINMTAPSTPGTYRTQWMVKRGDRTFGPNMYIDVTVPNTPSPSNIALNRTAWATSQESSTYAPSKGNDGNRSSRWSSAISSSLPAQWYKIDLGSNRTFNRFVVRWENAYGARYYVAWCDNNCTSNTNSNWSGYERRLSSRQDDVIDFGAQTHRYIGVYMLDRAPRMNNFSFFEFEAYNRTRSISDIELLDSEQVPLPEDTSPTTNAVHIYLPAVSR